MAKKKIVKLTDAQYVEYIMSLKDEPALYSAKGELTVPRSVDKTEEKKKGK